MRVRVVLVLNSGLIVGTTGVTVRVMYVKLVDLIVVVEFSLAEGSPVGNAPLPSEVTAGEEVCRTKGKGTIRNSTGPVGRSEGSVKITVSTSTRSSAAEVTGACSVYVVGVPFWKISVSGSVGKDE